MRIDVARKDEIPQSLTSEEVEAVKQAINVPRANVYIKPFHVYSTEEQVVAKWIDGSDVYEKTYILNSAVTIGKSTWTTIVTDSNLSNVNRLIKYDVSRGTTAARVDIPYGIRVNGNKVEGYDEGSASIVIKEITIRYTKAS